MSGTEWQIPDITTKQDLSAAGGTALDFTTTIGRPFKLGEIIINFNDGATPPIAVAVTETITITIDSTKGAIYDTIKVKRSLIAESNFVYRPQGNPDYHKGDEIRIQCTADNATGIANVLVKAKELLH